MIVFDVSQIRSTLADVAGGVGQASQRVMTWSSMLASWITILLNREAHGISRAKRHGVKKYPDALTDEEVKVILHLTAVEEPLRRSTKLLEGDGDDATISLYLLIFHQLRVAYGSAKATLQVPSELRGKHGEQIRKIDLAPLARKLMDFLHKDIEKIRNKHIRSTRAEMLLRMATHLDPRFRTHPCLSREEREDTKKIIAEWAYKAHEAHDGLVAHFKRLAEDPDNQFIALPSAHSHRGRGTARGRGAGRRRRTQVSEKVELPLAQIFPSGATPPLAQPSTPRRKLARKTSTDEFLFGSDSPALGEADVEGQAEKIRKLIAEELLRYIDCKM